MGHLQEIPTCQGGYVRRNRFIFFVFFSQAVVDSGAMESLVLCLEEPSAMSWVVNPIFSDTPL